MKLNEISTDKGLDVVCDLTLPLTIIAEDKELIKAIYKKNILKKEVTQEEKSILGTIQFVKNLKIIVPSLLKTHRPEVYEILSIINEKNIEEIKNQSVVETMKQIKELTSDQEFKELFTLLLN